jgi:hypothetical protein
MWVCFLSSPGAESLPMGTATVYTARDHDDKPEATTTATSGGGGGNDDDAHLGQRAFFKDEAITRGTGCDRQESVVAQFLAYEAFENSERICSEWHGGPGQTVNTLGSDVRQRCDALLSMPWTDPETGVVGKRLAYVNYHGMRFHGRRDHLDDCPQRLQQQKRRGWDPSCGAEVFEHDAEEEEEEEDGGVCDNTDDYDEFDYEDMECDDMGEARQFRREREEKKKKKKKRRAQSSTQQEQQKQQRPRVLTLSDFWPGSGGTLLTNPEAQALLPHLAIAPECLGKTKDEEEDDFRFLLADALTAATRAAGLTIKVTYAALTECELFHGNFHRFDRVARLGCSTSVQEDNKRRPWPKEDIRTYMRRLHPDKIIFGPEWPLLKQRNGEFTQNELVSKIISSPSNASGEKFGGFLLIRGGRQSEENSDNMGYCLQRSHVSVDELGPMTWWQAVEMCDGDEDAARQLLEKYCKNEQTLCRTAYPSSGGGELIGVDLFRWLCLNRGFHGYRILHFVHYSHTHQMNSFLDPLQQARHDLKR